MPIPKARSSSPGPVRKEQSFFPSRITVPDRPQTNLREYLLGGPKFDTFEVPRDRNTVRKIKDGPMSMPRNTSDVRDIDLKLLDPWKK